MLSATRFEELVVWQLSEDIKDRVFKVVARPKVAKDYKYCRQIRESTHSTSALIAEGFGTWSREGRIGASYWRLLMYRMMESICASVRTPAKLGMPMPIRS
jgi:23S rRNA-intervening sequence protein